MLARVCARHSIFRLAEFFRVLVWSILSTPGFLYMKFYVVADTSMYLLVYV